MPKRSKTRKVTPERILMRGRKRNTTHKPAKRPPGIVGYVRSS